MNVKRNTKRAATMKQKKLELRNQLWPNCDKKKLWDRKMKTGFTTIPRTMPHILRIMDDLADNGKPVSGTYLCLWCRVFDESFVEVKHPNELAYESGFSGQRALTSWKIRMKKLVELGFIEAKPGACGDFNYILLLNPYDLMKQYFKDRKIQELKYNALFARSKEIGAEDL